jgi:vanillate O-demethylase monooxygenase subunit
MSGFVRNAWYVAAWSREIDENLFTRRILNEPVVLYRTSNGEPVAMLDRCPHKLAPLSLGQLIDDRLQCGYHGLEFDCTGACVRVPGQDKIPPQAKATVFPVVERYNAIWIWMGDPELADPDRIVQVQRYGMPGWAVIDGQYQYHKSNYINIAENLVDPAHTTYVHKQSIGNEAADEVPVTVSVSKDEQGNDYVLAHRWTNNAEPPPIDKSLGRFSGLTDRCQYYHYYLPCVSRVDVVTINAGTERTQENMDKGLRAFSYKFLTPETESCTHFFWMHVRNFRVDENVDDFVEGMNATFQQDNVIASAIQKEQEVTGAVQHAYLAIDVAPSRVRKMLGQMTKAENEAKTAG